MRVVGAATDSTVSAYPSLPSARGINPSGLRLSAPSLSGCTGRTVGACWGASSVCLDRSHTKEDKASCEGLRTKVEGKDEEIANLRAEIGKAEIMLRDHAEITEREKAVQKREDSADKIASEARAVAAEDKCKAIQTLASTAFSNPRLIHSESGSIPVFGQGYWQSQPYGKDIKAEEKKGE